MRVNLLALLLAITVLAGCGKEPVSHHGAVDSTFTGTDVAGIDYETGFQLVDHNGLQRTLSDFQGDLKLVFFGFANCPDVCPTVLAKMGQAVALLEKDSEKVQGLFVSLDPARDTPEVLKHYVTQFHPEFLGLRAHQKVIEEMTKNYHVHMKSHASNAGEHGMHSAENYMVEHTGAVFVLDEEGKLRLLFVGGEWTPEQMANDLKTLLKA